jgi:hypothetical protein
MTIRPGHQVEGYCGPAKFQPKTSSLTQARTGKQALNSHVGGSMQFLLGLSLAHSHRIHGPIATLQLSKKKLQPKSRC